MHIAAGTISHLTAAPSTRPRPPTALALCPRPCSCDTVRSTVMLAASTVAALAALSSADLASLHGGQVGAVQGGA